MKSLLFLIVLLFSQITFSQTAGWQVQIGGSDPSNFNRDVFFLNSLTGWITQTTNIKYTSNGGNSWAEYTNDSVYGQVFFIDQYTGWMLSSKIKKTSNSGQSWYTVNNSVYARKIFFINSLTGWGCNFNGICIKTTDGGTAWNNINTGITDNINAVYFLNEQTGFLAADWGKILTTTNGGVNWMMYYDDVNYSFMESIEFINMQTGFVSATGGNIFKTTNAGINWLKYSTPNFSAFKDISFSDNLNGFAMGNGDIFRTTNGGNSWFQTSSAGLFANTFGLEAIGNGKLWLIADSSLVYMSQDNAQTWVEKYRQFITYSNLNSVKFINPLTGYACGNSGTLIKTTNGGTNWFKQATGITGDLNTLYFLNQFTGFMAGGILTYDNIILRTTNSGQNWTVVLSDTSGCLFNLFFLNENTGWAAGYRGVLKTTNGGMNWFRLTPYPAVLAVRDVNFINENTGFAIRYSSNGGYYKTTNAGLNWIFFPAITLSNAALNFINSSTGYILGNGTTVSILLKTTDSGNNWSNIIIGPKSYSDIYFVNQNKGWIAGGSTDGYIKITNNGGENWSAQQVNIFTGLSSVYFISENEGWACGGSGTIIHTTTGGIGITKINEEIPAGFILYQNYPNPFNPATKIRFAVPKNSGGVMHKVNLTVYDILGREVYVPADGFYDAGTYEVTWDASNFATGIYFFCYRVLSGSEKTLYIDTKKMILLK